MIGMEGQNSETIALKLSDYDLDQFPFLVNTLVIRNRPTVLILLSFRGLSKPEAVALNQIYF